MQGDDHAEMSLRAAAAARAVRPLDDQPHRAGRPTAQVWARVSRREAQCPARGGARYLAGAGEGKTRRGVFGRVEGVLSCEWEVPCVSGEDVERVSDTLEPAPGME